jgi:NAD(P)-dependent dehydrogenase (short-subunit alcohol dehydrogenase family)
MLAINVRPVFIATQEAARHMSDSGRIINIGSVNADRMPFMGGAVYAMTKAAIVGLMRGLARDLGPRGITVNNVQPGPVETDMKAADGPLVETLKGLMALKRYAKRRRDRRPRHVSRRSRRILRHRRQPNVPPWRSRRAFEIVRPRPSPPNCLVIERAP